MQGIYDLIDLSGTEPALLLIGGVAVLASAIYAGIRVTTRGTNLVSR